MTETDRPLAPLITMTESERALAESKGESAAFRAELGLMSNTERNVVVLLRRSLAELDAQRAARATAYAEGQRAAYAAVIDEIAATPYHGQADLVDMAGLSARVRDLDDAARELLRDAPAPRPAPAPTAQQGDSE